MKICLHGLASSLATWPIVVGDTEMSVSLETRICTEYNGISLHPGLSLHACASLSCLFKFSLVPLKFDHPLLIFVKGYPQGLTGHFPSALWQMWGASAPVASVTLSFAFFSSSHLLFSKLSSNHTTSAWCGLPPGHLTPSSITQIKKWGFWGWRSSAVGCLLALKHAFCQLPCPALHRGSRVLPGGIPQIRARRKPWKKKTGATPKHPCTHITLPHHTAFQPFWLAWLRGILRSCWFCSPRQH